MIYQNTIILVCHIKRNVFVGNLGSCSSILVPAVYDLTVFYKCRKSFTKSVNTFARIQGQLCCHIWCEICCHIILQREFGLILFIILHIAQIAVSTGCQDFTVCLISDKKMLSVYAYLHSSCSHNCFFFIDLHINILHIPVQIKTWLFFFIAFEMPASHADHIFADRCKFCCDRSYVQCTCTICYHMKW